MSSTLIAKNLAKSYKGRKVVHDVSVSIESGQIVGLLGPNGAGKTTCFYMIVGLVKADKGTVFIDQTDVSFQPMHGRARAGIGYLPQEASIFRKLGYLRVAQRLRPCRTPASARRVATRVQYHPPTQQPWHELVRRRTTSR